MCCLKAGRAEGGGRPSVGCSASSLSSSHLNSGRRTTHAGTGWGSFRSLGLRRSSSVTGA
eukprot:10494207-Lingulodinium_polyedra.AAC.1